MGCVWQKPFASILPGGGSIKRRQFKRQAARGRGFAVCPHCHLAYERHWDGRSARQVQQRVAGTVGWLTSGQTPDSARISALPVDHEIRGEPFPSARPTLRQTRQWPKISREGRGAIARAPDWWSDDGIASPPAAWEHCGPGWAIRSLLAVAWTVGHQKLAGRIANPQDFPCAGPLAACEPTPGAFRHARLLAAGISLLVPSASLCRCRQTSASEIPAEFRPCPSIAPQ